MCNRIRGLKEWSEIPRSLTRSLINFEYNPNVAPTEQVPAFLAERGKPLATRMARFGINLASSGGKRRPHLLNARTDSLRRGSFKTMLANKRCVIPAEGFYEWREEHGKKAALFLRAQGRQARQVRRHLGLFGRQRRSGSVLRDPDRRAEWAGRALSRPHARGARRRGTVA
jgi:putative SOS response-associated peptidase YedK